MNQHTPGPWRVANRPTRNGVDVYVFEEATDGPVALAYGEDLNEARANASVIAAAPILLAALIEITRLTGDQAGESFKKIDQARMIARAALAKVKGE